MLGGQNLVVQVRLLYEAARTPNHRFAETQRPKNAHDSSGQDTHATSNVHKHERRTHMGSGGGTQTHLTSALPGRIDELMSHTSVFILASSAHLEITSRVGTDVTP